MKTRLYLIIFIAIMTLSCNAKKDSGAVEPAHFTEIKQEYHTALENWTLASIIPFNEDNVKTIIYGNGRFVAAGKLFDLAYSDDGDTWHKVSPNIFGYAHLGGIAYGNGRFVAASYGDQIAYSEDGETWTLVKESHLGGDNDIFDISYGNGCFVAVGYNRFLRSGIIGYSSDGETWTLVEDGSFGAKVFNCVAYGNGQFIAGGFEGKAVYSSDGKTWSVIPGSPLKETVRIIAYGNGRFIVCSYFRGRDPKILYSDDGINWTPISKPPFNRDPINNIVYANGIFIAVSNSARMAYSSNGKTWHSGSDGGSLIIRPLEGTGDDLGGIAYGNGRFVIGCGSYGIRDSSRIAWCEFPSVDY